MKQPSILTRVIAATAEHLAQHPSIPAENRSAFRDAAETLMHGQWAAMFGGQGLSVRIYAPRISDAARQARRTRILAALLLGEAPLAIARREQVSDRWVRKLARLAAARNSPGMESSAAAAEDAAVP